MPLYPPETSTTIDPEPPASLHESCFAGVDVGGTNLRVAISNSTGGIVDRWSTSTKGIRDPGVIVDLISQGVTSLMDRNAISCAALRTIAAGAPGVTNVDQGIVIATSYLMGWRDVPLRDLLETAMGVPAFVDNDVNMAAFGESRAGAAQGFRDFVFLGIGTGLGAGIILNDQLLYGNDWTAGEIGYLLVPGTSISPVDRGNPGALEAIVGGEGIQAHWNSLWSESSSTLQRDATATEIFDYALQNNPLARAILGLSSRTLAYAIYNMSLILNCPLFVLGGSVGLHPALGDHVRATLKDLSVRVQPRVVASSLGSEAQLTGAVFRALELAKAGSVRVAPVSIDSANID